MMPLESEVESLRTKIEKVMMSLPSEQTDEQHRLYLSGYIDCLHDTNQISEEAREIIYAEYGC